MEEEIKQKLKLSDGEELQLTDHEMKGSFQETDIYSYDIVGRNGEKVGTVEYRHHTAIKGFKVTQALTQKAMDGSTIVDERW